MAGVVKADAYGLGAARVGPALRDAGCRRLFEEKLSGAQRNRPELARLLDQVRDDDVLVVRRLDRLARSRGRCTTCPKLHAKPPPAFQARFASASSCRC